MRISVVVGNPKPGSRTLGVANALAEAIGRGIGERQKEPSGRLVVDLADYAGRLFDWEASEVSVLNAQVAASDVIVVASPTYKATYTGMLKAFLDRFGNNGLAGTVAVALMTGGSPVHALAPEVYLRPLLVELGASLPTRGLFVLESQLPELDTVIAGWAEAGLPQLARALRLL
jgi:FMN reductase